MIKIPLFVPFYFFFCNFRGRSFKKDCDQVNPFPRAFELSLCKIFPKRLFTITSCLGLDRSVSCREGTFLVEEQGDDDTQNLSMYRGIPATLGLEYN